MGPSEWERLRSLESRDVVMQECKLATGRQPNAEHSREIASHVAQSRQYLEAAQDAGELARPLIVYYACLSLAKAVVMFRSHTREVSLAHAHGLSTKGWSGTLANGLRDFLNLRVGTTQGTFADLVAATKNAERVAYVRRGDLLEVTTLGSLTVPEGTDLTIGSVWHRITELRPLLAATHGATFDCWPAFVVRHLNQVHIELYSVAGRVPLEKDARRMMGLSSPATFSVAPPSDWASIQAARLGVAGQDALHVDVECTTDEQFRQVMAHFKKDDTHFPFLVEPIGGVNLSTLSLLFVAAFAAGMLVRYHPTTWQSLVRGDKGDRALVVLRKSVALAEGTFPPLALEAMTRPV